MNFNKLKKYLITYIKLGFICFKADSKPEVICSFTTEFDDHIFVTVDADAFFFLHDLITSYVKEKEKVVSLKFRFI